MKYNCILNTFLQIFFSRTIVHNISHITYQEGEGLDTSTIVLVLYTIADKLDTKAKEIYGNLLNNRYMLVHRQARTKVSLR
jgi:hypothetical protein